MPRTTFFEFLSEWEQFKADFAALKEKVYKDEPAKKEAIPETVYPIPDTYKETVKSILNQNFGMKITPRLDIPAFEFTIVVPEEYSRLSGIEEDIRMKVITNAEDNAGVRMWSERVYESFDSDVKAQIVSDRL